MADQVKATLVYLSIGSNLGDRAENLRSAITLLRSANFQVNKVSSFYETEPVDFLDQPWFLNCVVEGETTSDAITLLRALRKVESELGSNKQFAKGPRLLDIDILLFGDLSINTPELQVPHPRMLGRNFVLAPLAEIAPQLRHPSWPATVRELLANSPDRSLVRIAK
jgi:2-amino-4-hydroxy-6-hydroxymethyldihydropteridine diphosphokinase